MAASDDTKPYHVTSRALTLFQLRAFHRDDRWVMSVPFGEGPESYVLVTICVPARPQPLKRSCNSSNKIEQQVARN
jgi:hypothetical protein